MADPAPTLRGWLPTLRRWGRTELVLFLELLALCGLAIAQPLLDVTGRSPDFFLFYGAGAREILLLVALVTLAPPLLLWTTGALVRLAGPTAAGYGRGRGGASGLHGPFTGSAKLPRLGANPGRKAPCAG